MISVNGKKLLCIDAHAHVWEEIKGTRFGGVPIETLGAGRVKVGAEVIRFTDPAFNDLSSPIEVYLQHMEKNGIDKAMLLQTPCYGEQYGYIDRILREHPGRFRTVGLADPRDRDSYIRDVADVAKNRGYFGIKFEIPDLPFQMDAKENAFVWETILENDTYIVIDLGWGKGPYDFLIDQMTEVVRRYPTMKLVLPHLGVSHMWDRGEAPDYPNLRRTLELLRYNGKNLWFDVAGIPMMLREFEEYPYPAAGEILKVVKETVGFDRVMWGTDYPCVTEPCTYTQTLDMYVKHCGFLNDEEAAKFFGGNAQQLYFG